MHVYTKIKKVSKKMGKVLENDYKIVYNAISSKRIGKKSKK